MKMTIRIVAQDRGRQIYSVVLTGEADWIPADVRSPFGRENFRPAELLIIDIADDQGTLHWPFSIEQDKAK